MKKGTIGFWNIAQISKAKIECEEIYQNIFPELNDELNKYHKIKWNSKQYEKLLGNWVFNFIEIFYDRWLHCDDWIINHQNPILDLSSDIDDFQKNCIKDSFNDSINRYLRIIKDNGQLRNIEIPSKMNCIQNYSTIMKNKNPIQIHNEYHLNQRIGISGKINETYKTWRLRGLAQTIIFFVDQPVPLYTDQVWRLSLFKNRVLDFYEACKAFLRIYLPVVFLEGFKSLKECSEKSYAPFFYTANSTHSDIPFKFTLANWDRETRLLGHQHGGGYGIDLSCQGEKYDRSVSDLFYTWGWSEDQNTRPLPIPHRIQKRKLEKTDKLLLTCVNYPKYLYKLNYYHIGENNLVLIQDTIKFVKLIKHLDLEISYYRLDYEWDVRGRFKKANAIVPEKRLNHGEYALYICNYVGTTWLETLASNFPTICFYDPSVIAFRQNVKPLINALEKIGVLHTSPESAAEKVIEIYENPNNWWKAGEVQEVRSAFVNQYARFDDDWLVHWRDEFSRVLKSL